MPPWEELYDLEALVRAARSPALKPRSVRIGTVRYREAVDRLARGLAADPEIGNARIAAPLAQLRDLVPPLGAPDTITVARDDVRTAIDALRAVVMAAREPTPAGAHDATMPGGATGAPPGAPAPSQTRRAVLVATDALDDLVHNGKPTPLRDTRSVDAVAWQAAVDVLSLALRADDGAAEAGELRAWADTLPDRRGRRVLDPEDAYDRLDVIRARS